MQLEIGSAIKQLDSSSFTRGDMIYVPADQSAIRAIIEHALTYTCD